MSSPAWTTPLIISAFAFLAPLLARALSRAFPPRRLEPEYYDVLQARHNALEIRSRVFAVAGLIASVCFLIVWHPGNTPWLVGVIFGWAVLAPVLLIAACTLPKGFVRWHEFWRFYELRHKIRLRFLGLLYTLLCLVGLISTAVVLQRQ
jgi:hypothetical protein